MPNVDVAIASSWPPRSFRKPSVYDVLNDVYPGFSAADVYLSERPWHGAVGNRTREPESDASALSRE